MHTWDTGIPETHAHLEEAHLKHSYTWDTVTPETQAHLGNLADFR